MQEQIVTDTDQEKAGAVPHTHLPGTSEDSWIRRVVIEDQLASCTECRTYRLSINPLPGLASEDVLALLDGWFGTGLAGQDQTDTGADEVDVFA